MVTCEVVEGKNEGVNVYGFKFFDNSSGEEVYSVEDVFTDRIAAYSLCDAVNQSDLCKEHIADIIEDSICK